MEHRYEIELEVPLGIRKGIMSVSIKENQVSGELEVLGNKEVFDGVILEDGVICIKGTLVSLVRNIPYKGIGSMEKNSLKMLLCVQDDSYKVTGHRISSEKGNETE